jgi:DNA-binding PadR family transcriptional regulator
MKKADEVVSNLILELRRGIVVLMVLSQLKKAKYGYQLVKTFSDKGIDIPANTLYPLLRRLEKQELLESSWETGENKPRKYYHITDLGTEVYEKLLLYWHNSVIVINSLTGGNENE